MENDELLSSVLLTIKKMLGLDPSYTPYDADLIIFINSALMIASQFGVGPAEGYSITSEEDTWGDILGDDETKLSALKSYVYLKTRLLFDPPANSFVVSAIESHLQELEWRLNVRAEEV